MADTPIGDPMSRRDYGTGSLFQKCEARFGCPPLDGNKQRPKHKCKGRWHGLIDDGFTESGDRRRISVSAKTKAAAKIRLNEKVLERQAEGKTRKRTITVAKYAEQWLAEIQTDVRPSSWDTDRAAVKAITASIGHVKLSELDPKDVKRLAKYVRAKGNNSSTAQRYHGSLTRLLKDASINGYSIQPNVLLAKKPKPATNDRDAVSIEHAIQTLTWLGNLSPSHELVQRGGVSRWALAFLQGHRTSESRGLTWPEVDELEQTLTICWQVKSLKYLETRNVGAGFFLPDGYEAKHLVGATHLVRPKSDAGWRVQPLVPWAANALESWRAIAPQNRHGLVWPGRTVKGQTWPRNAASDLEEWHAIQRQVGIAHSSGRPYHVHEIRHGTATLLMALGIPESVRVQIMGHSSIASTKKYEHVDLSQARVALEAAAERLALR